MELPPWLQEAYQGLIGTAQQQPNQLANYDPGFKAPSNPYLTQGLENAAWARAPQYTTVNNNLLEQAAYAGTQVRNPYDVNFTNTYNPTAQQGQQFQGAQAQWEDTLAGYNPNMQAANIAGHGFEAQDYNFKADQVSAERMSEPERVYAERVASERAAWERAQAAQISPVERVQSGTVSADLINAPSIGEQERIAAEKVGFDPSQINNFLIGQMGGISPQELQRYQMQQPGDVSSRDVTSQMWTDPGVRDQYMDPYMKAVVAEQQKDAQRLFEEQNAAMQGSAAEAGAFGGTRQAVLESQARRDLANQKGMISATGLQSAYQSGQQQFERDRGASMQGQQWNQQAALQAALANQQMGFGTGQMNLQALMQQQELGANLGMRAQEFNNQQAMQIAMANQGAQMQGLGFGLQAGLANQQAAMQAAMANQSTGLDVARSNQDAALRAAMANQGAGLQAGQLNMQNDMQAQLANQAMGMDVARLNQQALMQAALANQSTGLQAGIANMQSNLQGQGMNQDAFLQAMMANQRANIDVGRYNQEAMLQAGMANQSANLEAQFKGAELGQSDRQFLGGLNNQMNMSQAELQQQANSMNTQLGFDALKTRYGGNLQAGLSNQQAAMDAMRMQEQSRQWAGDLGQRQTEFGSNLNLQTQQAQQQAMNEIMRQNLAATGMSADIWGQMGNFEGRAFDQSLAGNAQLLNAGFGQAGLDQTAQAQAYAHWMAQQQYPMQQALMMSQLMNPLANIFGDQTTTGYARGPSMLSQLSGGLMALGGLGMNYFMPGAGAAAKGLGGNT